MTTLATLKSEIDDDLDGGVSAAAIANAINRAIAFYDDECLWFTDARDVVFNTIADQAIYTADDDTDIGRIIKPRHAYITDNNTIYDLNRGRAHEYENANDASGRPTQYAFQSGSFWLYPTPDNIYSVRVRAHVKVPGPSTDDEANNEWMTFGFQLIRYHALVDLCGNKLRWIDGAANWNAMRQQELLTLRRKTDVLRSTGQIKPSEY